MQGFISIDSKAQNTEEKHADWAKEKSVELANYRWWPQLQITGLFNTKTKMNSVIVGGLLALFHYPKYLFYSTCLKGEGLPLKAAVAFQQNNGLAHFLVTTNLI